MFDNPPASMLIGEVRTALEAGLAAGFPQKVAANALGIGQRELELGSQLKNEARARLAALLEKPGSFAELNAALCTVIRDGEIGTSESALVAHLIATCIAKMEIDQPTYPAFRAWRAGDGESDHG